MLYCHHIKYICGSRNTYYRCWILVAIFVALVTSASVFGQSRASIRRIGQSQGGISWWLQAGNAVRMINMWTAGGIPNVAWRDHVMLPWQPHWPGLLSPSPIGQVGQCWFSIGPGSISAMHYCGTTHELLTITLTRSLRFQFTDSIVC